MSYFDECLADNAAILLKFEETGGGVAEDSSGDNHDATYSGVVYYDQGSVIPSGEGSSVRVGNEYADPFDPGPDAGRFNFGVDDITPLTLAPIHALEMTTVIPEVVGAPWVAYAYQFELGSIVIGTEVGFGEAPDEGVVLFSAYSADFMTTVTIGGYVPRGVPVLIQVDYDPVLELVTLLINGEVPTGVDNGVDPPYPSGPEPWTTPFNNPAGGPSFNGGVVFGSLAMFPATLGADRLAAHYEAWNASTPPTIAYGRSSAIAELEVSTLDFIYFGASGSGASGVTAVPELIGAHYMGGYGTGRASTSAEYERSLEREGSAAGLINIFGETGDFEIFGTGTGLGDSQSGFSLIIYDTEHRRSPTALTVTVSGASPGGTVEFRYDDGEVFATAQIDDSGTTGVLSLEVYPMPAGEHILKATDDTGREAWAKFTLLWNPTTPKTVSQDADPIEVPGAANGDDTWNWVLQDLMPGGLGSYIFKRNPVTMDKPMFERRLTSQRTTSPRGKHHIFEGNDPSWEWRFTGVAFTQDDQEKLYAFLDLNRRFYLIDHRNRAWVCTFTQVDMVPRLRKTLVAAGDPAIVTDWLADFTVTAINHEKQWRTPIPLED